MATEENKIKHWWNTWLPTIVSIAIGAILTVGVAFYQFKMAEKEGEKAEKERFTKVKDNLVSLLEGKIVNAIVLDIPCMSRIIDNRMKLESLHENIYLIDILSEAEYNILSSNHLDVKKKEQCKAVLDKYYKNLQRLDSLSLNVIDTLCVNFTYKSEAQEFLDKLKHKENTQELANSFISIIRKYENEVSIVKTEKAEKTEKIDLFSTIIENPTAIILVLFVYIFILIMMYYWRKKMIRRRRLLREKNQCIDEIEKLNRFLEKAPNDIDKAMLLDRLEMLQHKLSEINSILW